MNVGFNISLIYQAKDFIQWVKRKLNKSCCFSIDVWAFTSDSKEEITYRLWIDDLVNNEIKTVEELMETKIMVLQYYKENFE